MAIQSAPGVEDTKIFKVKGITLNSGNSQLVNFDTLKDMVLNGNRPLTVHDPLKIIRPKIGSVITTKQDKMYRVVYDKRRIVGDYNTVPYGY